MTDGQETPPLLAPAFALLARDVRLATREGGALGTALGFYLVVVAMLPLSLGPDLALLGRIAPGVLWVALLLSALLSLPRMFESDSDDGTLEILGTGPLPLEVVAAVKAFAHWVTTAVPLAVIAPVLGLLLNLELAAMPALLMAMLIGTPAVSYLGAIGAALTVRSRRGGLLVALLLLPLYAPTLIFGIAALGSGADEAGTSLSATLVLGAISLVAIVLGPIAAAAALRAQMA